MTLSMFKLRKHIVTVTILITELPQLVLDASPWPQVPLDGIQDPNGDDKLSCLKSEPWYSYQLGLPGSSRERININKC